MKRLALKTGRVYYTQPIRDLLSDVDERLVQYFDDILERGRHAQDEPYEDPNNRHNVYEILCAARFLRLYSIYDFDARKVRQVIRLREGDWQRDSGGIWRHVRGGIKCPSNSGAEYYRWEPFQVFVLASIYGFRCWVPTGDRRGSRDMTAFEKIIDGEIYDYRRLCTDFTNFMARKTDKTGLAAFIQTEFFLLEDYNSEIYCVANSSDQSKILFGRTRDMLRQIDAGQGRLHMTATIIDWQPRLQAVRKSQIRPLSAGGKKKDGLMAQLLCADEYGSAAWVKNHNDMKSLVDVVQSSMGSRREPLSFFITTAGANGSGPFEEKLEGLHRLLEREITMQPTANRGKLVDPTDRTLCLLLEPDAWERDEETLLTSKTVRYKVNPMIGKIVQHSFYDEEAAKVRLDPTYITEYVPKLMNVYRSGTTQEWITPAQVRALHVPARITDVSIDRGNWIVFAGLDFSLGDDLHAASYLAFNLDTKEFFADCDSWITRKTLESSAMRDVYQHWIDDGWMSISPGETLAPELPINRIVSLLDKRVNFACFLYDPYKSLQPINLLSNYLTSWFRKAGRSIDLSSVIMPCRQNYATFNPLVMEMDYMVKAEKPLIHFSRSPLWAWEAGNMVLDVSTDGMENRKPRKRDAGAKIDNWIALLQALKGYDILDGRNINIETNR